MRLPKGLSIVSVQNIKVAKLYSTNIVEIIDNRIKLRTGGWRTKHTKKCMNLILNPLGLNVIQKDWEWYVYQNGTQVAVFQDDNVEVSI